MSNKFVNSGLIFPLATYHAGDQTSDDIIFSGAQQVPFAINLQYDQDLVVHIDIYIGDVVYEDWLVQAAEAVDSPLTLHIFSVLARFKVRLEISRDTVLTCDVVSKEVR